MNIIEEFRTAMVVAGMIAAAWAGTVYAQEPEQRDPVQGTSATAAHAPAPAVEVLPSTAQNADGTQGMVVLDGDSAFTRSGVVMRSKSEAQPYIAAQPSANGGFVVAPAPGQERFVVQTGGNVGVGTLFPAAKLHISGGAFPLRIFGSTAFGVSFYDTAVASPVGDGLVMEMAGNSSVLVSNLQIGEYGIPRVSSKAGDLLLAGGEGAGVMVGSAQKPAKLSVTGPSTLTGAVSTGGDLAVGAAGSSAKLIVNGTGTSEFRGPVSMTGSLTVNGDITGARVINAIYRDFAEWVDSDQPLRDGTVVIVAPHRADHVIASTAPYDTRVAGVVSPEPGVLLGLPGEGKVKVATTGRVRVRVDASADAIAIGDLLVSSARTGLAMKSVPLDLGGVPIHRPGTLIGKALEALPHGEGEILVLLSLQ